MVGVAVGVVLGGLGMYTVNRSTQPEANINTGEKIGKGYGLGYQGSSGQGTRLEVNAQNCLGDECLGVEGVEYPVGELSQEVQDALNQAIQDEYKARTTYEAVIEEFGMVRPFAMIIRAEEQHINALKAVYDRYGLEPPEAESLEIEMGDTLADMCAVGVEAEIDNAALYRDRLLSSVSEHEDIVFVFTNLMNASKDKHLPAFQRCAAR